MSGGEPLSKGCYCGIEFCSLGIVATQLLADFGDASSRFDDASDSVEVNYHQLKAVDFLRE